MANRTITGFIHDVGSTELVGANKTTMKQTFVLHIPAYTYQDRQIEEEHWHFAIIGDAVSKIDLNMFHVGERAIVTFGQTSKKFEKDGKTMYIVNNRAFDIKWQPR